MLNDIKTIKYKKVFGGNFSNNVNIKFAIDDVSSHKVYRNYKFHSEGF